MEERNRRIVINTDSDSGNIVALPENSCESLKLLSLFIIGRTMREEEIVVGKKVIEPPWLTQKSVVLRKYIREMYSPYTLLVLQERGGEIYVDGDLVTDLTTRIKPTSDVVVYACC